jgi:carbon storage regulator
MLILGRKVGDSILIGDDIKVVVLANDRGGVRIGIDAPKGVTILRGEIVSDVTAENQRAGASDAAGTQEWLKVIGGPKPDAPSASASVTRPRPPAE